jgi:hypothetical protein
VLSAAGMDRARDSLERRDRIVDLWHYKPRTRFTNVISASSIVSPLAAFARQLALGSSVTNGAAIAIATTEIAITASAHSCVRVIEPPISSPVSEFGPRH